MFFSMLKRLITEFAPMEQRAESVKPEDLDGLAAQLHKLKGSAGTLGAGALERAASLADKACRTRQLEQVGHLVVDVVEELEQLRGAVAPFLKAHEVRLARRINRNVARLDLDALSALLDALQRNDLCALDQLNAMAAGLKPHLGDEGLAHLLDQVDNLAFAEAAAVLQPLLATEASA